MQNNFQLLKGPFHSFQATFWSGNFCANMAECLETLKNLINRALKLTKDDWNDVILDMIMLMRLGTYTKDSIKRSLMLPQEIIQLQVRLSKILVLLWLFPIPVFSGGRSRWSFYYSHLYAHVFSCFIAPWRYWRTRPFHLELNSKRLEVDTEIHKQTIISYINNAHPGLLLLLIPQRN